MIIRKSEKHAGLTAVAASLAVLLLAASTARAQQPCIVPDNGSGTADHPAYCPYSASRGSVMTLSAGMPTGTTLQMTPTMSDLQIIFTSGGGTLGGEIEAFFADLTLELQGTGLLAGYTHTINTQTVGYFHTAPRTPGAPVQDFDIVIFQLIATFNGDPDFCEIDLRAGSDFDLPSPGHTTFTLLPGGEFEVASTVDLNWELTWTGCAGSELAGMGGVDTGVLATAQGNAIAIPAMTPGGAAVLVAGLLLAGGTILRQDRASRRRSGQDAP